MRSNHLYEWNFSRTRVAEVIWFWSGSRLPWTPLILDWLSRSTKKSGKFLFRFWGLLIIGSFMVEYLKYVDRKSWRIVRHRLRPALRSNKDHQENKRLAQQDHRMQVAWGQVGLYERAHWQDNTQSHNNSSRHVHVFYFCEVQSCFALLYFLFSCVWKHTKPSDGRVPSQPHPYGRGTGATSKATAAVYATATGSQSIILDRLQIMHLYLYTAQ